MCQCGPRESFLGLDSYTERRGRVDAFLFFLSLPRGWGTVPKTRGVELVVVVVFDEALVGFARSSLMSRDGWGSGAEEARADSR